MKKFIAWIAAGCAALSLAGCHCGNTDNSHATLPLLADSTRDTPSITVPSKETIPMNAIALPFVKETTASEDGTQLFSLSFQRTQVTLSNTAAEEKILGDLQSRNGSILENAYQIEAQAYSDYSESEYWNSYFVDIAYTPTRVDQTVLSLFGNTSCYSGGPHPSLIPDCVTYDVETGSVLYLDDILINRL